MKPTAILTLLLLAVVTATSNAQDLVWTVGLPGDGWPQGLTGGGPDTVFVQETGTNELPGDPENPVANQQSDDDYYFAGVYTTVLDGGNYDPVGTVEFNEEGKTRYATLIADGELILDEPRSDDYTPKELAQMIDPKLVE